MCRYIEYVDIASEKVIVEIRALDTLVEINGKHLQTNKWLKPHHWQEVYYILRTAFQNHLKNKRNGIVVAHGKDTEMALQFKPYLPAYQYIIKQYKRTGNVLEALDDSGDEWIETTPYKSMIVASVSPKLNSNTSRSNSLEVGCFTKSSTNVSCDTRNETQNLLLGNIVHGEIIWQSVEEFCGHENNVKLEKKELQSLPKKFVIPKKDRTKLPDYEKCLDSETYQFNSIDEEYSQHNESSNKQIIYSSSCESSSVSYNKLTYSEETFVNRTSNSLTFSGLRSGKQKISLGSCDSVVNKDFNTSSFRTTKYDSMPEDERDSRNKKVKSKTNKLSTVQRQKRKCAVTSAINVNEENVWKTDAVMKNIERNSIVKNREEKKGKEEDQDNSSGISSRTNSLNTGHLFNLVSKRKTDANDSNCNRKSLTKGPTIKKSIKCLERSNKKVCRNDATIKHYFHTKSNNTVSAHTSSEQRENNSTEPISDESCSDSYVPGTPTQTMHLTVLQSRNNDKKSLVKISATLNGSLKKIKPDLDSGVDKNKSESVCDLDTKKEMSSHQQMKRSKQVKRSKLSTRKTRLNSTKTISKKDETNNISIQSYFSSTHETSKYVAAKKIEFNAEDANCSIGNENTINSSCSSVNKVTRETQEYSLSEFCMNEFNKVHENVSESSVIEEKNDTSSDVVLRPKAEPYHKLQTTSSVVKIQNFQVSHLTLKQLEKRYESNVQYLCDIRKGQQYCLRHEKFKEGGFTSFSRHYATATEPFTDQQLNHLLRLLRETFSRNHNFVSIVDYLMTVLLPEICTKIFMDEFSLSHEEALCIIKMISSTAQNEPVSW